MSEPPGPPPRPLPPRGPRDLVVGWLSWIGPVRLIATVLAVVGLGAGGYWLVRAPTPPTEASLPFAAAASTTATEGSTASAPSSSTPVAATEPANAVVHVAGAVVGPGVYRLDGAARVHTAIDAAGGPTADADLDGLNLAAPIVDGQRIYVPVTGEVDPAEVATLPDPSDVGAVPPIDLNRAGAAELESLPGVGPATAAAIVEERARNGPFATVDDLDRVSGIGPAKLEAIRDLVTV